MKSFLIEGTNSPRLFTPGETKALAKSKVHQSSRALTNSSTLPPYDNGSDVIGRGK
jgi:hypothetical protein